jgi:4-amino-4-deoxy-L-arabinose transferase-like glycosyltransferase
MAVFAALIVAVSPLDTYSGDELYFVIAGRHLSWGYADAPPMTAVFARVGETIFPHSTLALRVPIALVLPWCILVTALIARELGGGRRAQLLAVATVLTCPQVLIFSRWLTNDAVDMTLWSLSIWLLIRWLRLRDGRLLLAIGAATAVALENKYLIATFWLVVGLTLMVIGPRDIFRRPQLWIAAAFAGLSVIPGLLWQAGHGWRGLQMGVVAQGQATVAAAYGFGFGGGRLIWLPALLGSMGLAGVVLFSLGLWWLLRTPGQLRFLGWAVVVLTIAGLCDNLPTHLLAGLFPLCWAVAAVRIEAGFQLRSLRWVPAWPTFLIAFVLLIAGMIPVRNLAVSKVEQAVLVDHRDNWAGLTMRVAQVAGQLTASERRTVVVIGGDYQRSSALEYYRADYHLPAVYGDVRGYWNFGTPPAAQSVIYLDPVPPALRSHCGHLDLRSWYVDREPTGQVISTPIYVCTALTAPLPSIWPLLWTMSTPSGMTT